jgi:pilus assembly protein FimV
MTISPDAILAAIDRHLAAIPAGRSTVTVEEHRDVLLDLRLSVTGANPAPAGGAPAESATEPAVEAIDDEPAAGVPDDFDLEPAVAELVVDPALTGLDLAREITVPAEGRADDFPDEIDDVLDDPFDDQPAAAPVADGPEPEPEPEVEPAPEPEPEPVRAAVVHLRLAASKIGVIARCGELIDPGTGDTSTPWGEEVTCPDCLAKTDDDDDDAPTGDTDDDATRAAAEPDSEAGEAATDAAADKATQTVGAALPDDDGTEPSWIHDDGDAPDTPLIHQLAEVEGTGHGKNKIAKAKCGNVETVLKSESFAETASWLDDVTCPDCIALRHQASDRSAAA